MAQVVAWPYSKTLETGVVANYWVMTRMQIDMSTDLAQVTYQGFLDQSAHDSGMQNLVEQTCTIDFSSFDPTGQLAAGVIAMVSAIQAAGG